MKSAPQRGCGSGIAVSLMERICFRSSVVLWRLYFCWISGGVHSRPSREEYRIFHSREPTERSLKQSASSTLKAQRWNLRRHLVSRPAPPDVLLGLQYNICLLERYRSNMWYRPEQNERMQRSSAPVSNSSCSGFLIFFSKTPCEMPFQQFYIWETKHHTLKVNHEIAMQ